jgi:hypothetical protein
MSEPAALRRGQVITVDMVKAALMQIVQGQPDIVEAPEPVCEWPRLCGDLGCRFPRYQRGGGPVGLTAHVLLELGYPLDVLKELDCEYEIGEVMHPGVKIARSRNAALARIDRRGMALLGYLQDNQKTGRSWSGVAAWAYRPLYKVIPFLDSRRRPWLY